MVLKLLVALKVKASRAPRSVISIRGNKSLFDPDRMTLKSLDKQDAEKLRLQRKEQNSAALEAKEKLLRLDDDRRRVVAFAWFFCHVLN